jgi:signal transduction histidine kinase
MLELQGSRIELVDLAGQGAVFRFVLPSASRPA